MYKGAILIETGRVPQRVVAQLGVMEYTVISSVTATPSPWSKRTETFAPSWVAIRAFLAVYLFVSTHKYHEDIDFSQILGRFRDLASHHPRMYVYWLVGSQDGFEGHLYLVYRCHSEMEQVLE